MGDMWEVAHPAPSLQENSTQLYLTLISGFASGKTPVRVLLITMKTDTFTYYYASWIYGCIERHLNPHLSISNKNRGVERVRGWRDAVISMLFYMENSELAA